MDVLNGPPACLRARVVTAGRRWEEQGLWRTILLMWRLHFDYWRGVPAHRLAARYHAPGRDAAVRWLDAGS